MKIVFDNFGAGDSNANSAFIAPQINLHYDYIEGELCKTTWFAGKEFTAADIQMSFPLEVIAVLPEQIDSRPKSRTLSSASMRGLLTNARLIVEANMRIFS